MSLKNRLINKVKTYYNYYNQDLLPVWKFRFSIDSARWKKLKNKYYGQRCFIIGNGPSLKKQDLTVLRDEVTFVTNWFPLHEEYEKINPKYYCVCGYEIFGGVQSTKNLPPIWNKSVQFNPALYKLLKQKAQNTIKVFPSFYKNGIESQKLFNKNEAMYLLYERPIQEVHKVQRINLDIDSQRLLMGHTVINIFCLPIAYYLGFKEIYLLGCDCDYGIEKPEDSRQYFYDSTKQTTDAPSFEWLQKSWASSGPMIESYAVARREFEKRGRMIYNATAGGKLEVFPRVNFEDVVSRV